MLILRYIQLQIMHYINNIHYKFVYATCLYELFPVMW